MKNWIRVFTTIAAVGICVVADGAPALAAKRQVVDSWYVNSYSSSKATNKKGQTVRVKSTVLLESKLYVAVVSGTISYWAPGNFTGHINKGPTFPWTALCGTPTHGEVEFTSGGTANGKGGVDAQFVFARPWLLSDCPKVPYRFRGFQMRVGPNAPWAHPTPLLKYTTVRPDHTYEYAIAGINRRRAMARFVDVPSTITDNYGMLKVTLRRAEAADCANGQWTAFGLSSEAACLAKL